MTAGPEFAPQAGAPLPLLPGLDLILAPNPTPMTYLGTNTYVLGTDRLAIIDPGPNDPRHLRALLDRIGKGRVTHILVTHSHMDHSPLARPLQKITGAPVYAFGDSDAGKSPIMTQLSAQGATGGGEGIDRQFAPDHLLADSQTVTGAWGKITALHTPGHTGNHLCFIWDDVVFTGDHVMGWASSLVSPPDGDLSDFMASCRRLQTIPAQRYFPGHGAPIADPQGRLAWLIAHRENREAQIRMALSHGPKTVAAVAQHVYADVPVGLLAAAERNVFAHLIDLHLRGRVTARPVLCATATFALTQT